MRNILAQITACLRLMVGVGDYDAYVKHCAQHHPRAPVLSREDWYRERVNARYGGKKGVQRCPC